MQKLFVNRTFELNIRTIATITKTKYLVTNFSSQSCQSVKVAKKKKKSKVLRIASISEPWIVLFA